MKITLLSRSGNRYRKSDVVDQVRLLPVEYDSSVDVAYSVTIHFFGSTSMIHSISFRKRLPQTLLAGL